MISAVVLAAGLSRRFGSENKLTSIVDGVPLIRRAVEAVLSADAETWVVTGHEAPDVREALQGLSVGFVHNALYQDGMGGSIAAGVAACDPSSEGFLIMPGDMPNVTTATLRKMIELLEGPGSIVTLSDGVRQSSPTLFGADYRDALCEVRGDQGARAILQKAKVTALLVDPLELRDIDAPM